MKEMRDKMSKDDCEVLEDGEKKSKDRESVRNSRNAKRDRNKVNNDAQLIKLAKQEIRTQTTFPMNLMCNGK